MCCGLHIKLCIMRFLMFLSDLSATGIFLSAAIGASVPKCYVWRLCIGLQSALWLLVALAYWHHYRDYRYLCLCCAVPGLGLGKNLGLLLLTYVSSAENHAFHQYAFGLFIVSAIGHMFITCSGEVRLADTGSSQTAGGGSCTFWGAGMLLICF
uniref:Acyltransferase PGAP2 n=1 Tax=Naja naja TaxID=35670 RepID=A0A8C6VIZ8_NAJNA